MKHFTPNYLLMQINNGIWWKMTYFEGMDQQALNPNLDTYFLNQSINSVDSSMVNVRVTYKLLLVYSLQNLEKFWQIEANGNEQMQEESPILSYEKNSFVNCSCRKTLNAAYLNDSPTSKQYCFKISSQQVCSGNGHWISIFEISMQSLSQNNMVCIYNNIS